MYSFNENVLRFHVWCSKKVYVNGFNTGIRVWISKTSIRIRWITCITWILLWTAGIRWIFNPWTIYSPGCIVVILSSDSVYPSVCLSMLNRTQYIIHQSSRAYQIHAIYLFHYAQKPIVDEWYWPIIFKINSIKATMIWMHYWWCLLLNDYKCIPIMCISSWLRNLLKMSDLDLPFEGQGHNYISMMWILPFNGLHVHNFKFIYPQCILSCSRGLLKISEHDILQCHCRSNQHVVLEKELPCNYCI